LIKSESSKKVLPGPRMQCHEVGPGGRHKRQTLLWKTVNKRNLFIWLCPLPVGTRDVFL